MERELLTIPEHLRSLLVLGGVRDARSLVFCVLFWGSFFVLLSFFLWLLCCLFFDLLILIAPLVSSNSSLNRDGQQFHHASFYWVNNSTLYLCYPLFTVLKTCTGNLFSFFTNTFIPILHLWSSYIREPTFTIKKKDLHVIDLKDNLTLHLDT